MPKALDLARVARREDVELAVGRREPDRRPYFAPVSPAVARHRSRCRSSSATLTRPVCPSAYAGTSPLERPRRWPFRSGVSVIFLSPIGGYTGSQISFDRGEGMSGLRAGAPRARLRPIGIS